MKSPMLLWKVLADEIGLELGVDTSHDFKTVMRRCGEEGEKSFLTITLPKLGKALEQGLEQGSWNSQLMTSFSHHKGLPRFLGGFLELIFARESGTLLDNANPDAIRAVRQLSGLFGKVFEVCDERKVQKAMRSWIEVEQEVRAFADNELDEFKLKQFERAALAIWSKTFSDIDRIIDLYQVRPRHSNGSNADARKGNQKWQFVEWTNRLETVFPFVDYAVSSHRYWRKSEAINFLAPGAERPSKVVAVPKTAEKPRIISMEPSYMQYMQQGLAREFMHAFEATPAYADVVQLRRREHNQEAACFGSSSGTLATLDLSEASDRLSYRLVMRMFEKYPHLYEGVDASRTRSSQVGELGTISLYKFAPMGSALTFPIQTIVFTTIVFMGIAESLGISVGAAWMRHRKKVRVFGDDLVVPVGAVENVIRLLEAYGLKVNTNKSFWNGKFRESCGGDYYDGHDVTYVKVRSWLPDSLRDVEGVEAAVSLRTHFYEYGYWRTASYLDEELERLLKFYPPVGMSSPVLGRRTFLPLEGEKIHPRLQSPISKGYIPSRLLPRSPLDDADALLKFFTEEHSEMLAVTGESFERAGRPQHAALKLRWGSTA